MKGGPSTKAFVDPEKLKGYLNEANERELAYIRTLKDSLNRMEQAIVSTINDNAKKATDYMAQLNKGTADVQINVHN